MLKKTGKTPRSHAENLKNYEGNIFICYDCDKIIKESLCIKGQCPFCEGKNISKCELKIIEENKSNDASQN